MYDISSTPVDEIAKLEWVDKPIPPHIRQFSETLIRGSIAHLSEIDEYIVRHSKNWRIERLDAVDRAILRISLYALLYLPDIPHAVTIDEAIELGKIYGGENSGQFINGILDAVKREIAERATSL